MPSPLLRIFLIESDRDIINMFKVYFSSVAEIITPSNPAVDLSNLISGTYDAIIIDSAMTDVDPFLRAMRILEFDIPFLILGEDAAFVEKWRELYSNVEFIPNPFDIEIVRSRLNPLLNRLAGDNTTDAPPPDVKKNEPKDKIENLTNTLLSLLERKKE